MAETRTAHVPEIDWLKGFAILSVVCIHAKVYETTRFYEFVVNRAVPIFLVLFGITSELWWARAVPAGDGLRSALGRWYRGRLARLLPPVWAMATAWCAAVVVFDRTKAFHLGVPEALATYVGFAPWMGTSWFIALILQLVLLFPALEWLVRRTGKVLGPLVLLPLSAWLCKWCVWHVWDIVAVGKELLGGSLPEPGWYYAWIFVPRVLWHVLSGVYVARLLGGRPRPRFTALAVALSLVGAYACVAVRDAPDDLFVGPYRQQTIFYLFDVPAAIALLGLFRYLRPQSAVAAFLAWCGAASWGIYLGHMLVHEVLHMANIVPETGPDVIRVAYAVFLFGCGAVLAASGEWARAHVLAAHHKWRSSQAGPE
jgi:peptidoglycan/LPS O-acetylase OafA/YrhL